MRISFILDTFGGGGKERRCLMLIQGLIKSGYDHIQVIIINDGIDYKELFESRAAVTVVDRKTKNLSFFDTTKAVKTLLKDFKPDIVQTWGGISTLIPVLLKPFLKYKLIGAYVADADSPKIISLDRVYPAFCNKVVGNSNVGLRAYDIPKKKRTLIYNGFNEQRFERVVDKDEKKKTMNIATKYVVAMFAAFWRNKDWETYLSTAKKIVANRKDITFLAVGAGNTWEEHNKMIADEERELVRMLGRRDDVDELLQICDLTVLTSNHGEGVSNSIMESMAWGVPVIATNSGGTPEIIKDEENGLLLDRNDADLLAEKILRLIDNENTRIKLSKNAAETVRSRFMLDTMTQKYINLYNSL